MRKRKMMTALCAMLLLGAVALADVVDLPEEVGIIEQAEPEPPADIGSADEAEAAPTADTNGDAEEDLLTDDPIEISEQAEAPAEEITEAEAEEITEEAEAEPTTEEQAEAPAEETVWAWLEVPLTCAISVASGVTLDEEGRGAVDIAVSDLPEGHRLTVSVTTENGSRLESEHAALEYDLENAEGIVIEQDGTHTIGIAVEAQGKTYAGVYSDTLHLNYKQYAYLPREAAETEEDP